jgi:hypothetical protein
MPTLEEAPQVRTDSPSDKEIVVFVRRLTKVFKDFWNRPNARAACWPDEMLLIYCHERD